MTTICDGVTKDSVLHLKKDPLIQELIDEANSCLTIEGLKCSLMLRIALAIEKLAPDDM